MVGDVLCNYEWAVSVFVTCLTYFDSKTCCSGVLFEGLREHGRQQVMLSQVQTAAGTLTDLKLS
jgi:hypothetical protein